MIWCVLGILLLGLTIRWPLMRQSLWYDEMTTLTQYMLQPWSKIVACQRGEYVPNNHVLHSILAKLVYTGPDLLPPREAVLRLPAMVAGLLAPIALAWPLRRSNPLLALLIALVAQLHPWMVGFSTEARGYSMVLLFGIVGTNLIGSLCEPLAAEAARPLRGRWVILYAVAMALAIYTVPLAVFLLIGTLLALLISCLLYLPMHHGLLSYYRNPYAPSMSYREFLNTLPRCALSGLSTPTGPAIYWALPVIVLVIGSALGWARESLRPMIVTFAVTTVLGIVLPLMLPAATEVRFVPWILPWFTIAVVAGFCSAPARWGKIAGFLGVLVLLSWDLSADLSLLPQQPIREGIELVDKIAPPDRDVMVLYLGARESVVLYGNTKHRLLPAPDGKTMRIMMQKSLDDTGQLPWVIIYYEKLAKDRNFDRSDARGLWTNLIKLYDLKIRLPGRLTPVAIYQPKLLLPDAKKTIDPRMNTNVHE